MPRYTQMLCRAMEDRGYETEIWVPEPVFFRIKAPMRFKKWLGYIDQYIVFPAKIKKKIGEVSGNALFIFTDHALGPWVPLVKKHAHIIHCHDFLAQRSALGLIKENPTSFSGKIYQAYIKRGYRQGKNFISVSRKTEQDLLSFLHQKPILSEVVYNSLDQKKFSLDPILARNQFEKKININLSGGYILHVGGNQWYKNRVGVIEIYNALRAGVRLTTPLLFIGQKPSVKLKSAYDQSPFKDQIFFLNGIDDESVRQAYAGASVFIFPSLAEGFGWPITEAMASGCLVITTDEAPMTEVAGDCAFLIPKRPQEPKLVQTWAVNAAGVLLKALTLKSHEKQQIINKGLLNIKRFAPEIINDQIEKIYRAVYLNN